MVLGSGMMMALSPLVAHAYGAGEPMRVGAYARQGAWIATGLALLLLAGLAAARPVLAGDRHRPRRRARRGRLRARDGLGMPALLGFQALRYVSDGLGRTRPMMVISFAGPRRSTCSATGCSVYGRLGLPALGADGLRRRDRDRAMGDVRRDAAAMCAATAPTGRTGSSRASAARSLRRIGEILRLGLPMSGSMVAESALFSAAGLMLGTLGATVVAAHQIALNYASFTFMMPLALHSATTIHVGHTLGRGDARRGAARRLHRHRPVRAADARLGVAARVARGPIAGLYSRDPAVAALAARLLLLVAVFQVSDGLQVGAMGALRGFKDTRVPLAITIGAYWLVGFPVAFVFGLVRGGGPVAVWSGLIAGLAVSALALNLRYAAALAARRSRAGL